MALDTRDKRDSAINHGLPWRMRFPAPDGTIAQADRQHVSFLYRGIVAGAPAVEDITITNYPTLRGLANASKTMRGISPASPELKGKQ